MKQSSETGISRREVLLTTLKGTLAATAVVPCLSMNAAPVISPLESLEFVPENDYPFFGGELPEDS